MIDRRAEAGEDRVPVAARVVDRHMPLGDRHLGAHRDHESIGEDEVGHAHMRVLLVELAQREQAQAVVGRLDVELGPRELAQQPRHRDVGIGGGGAELLAVGAAGVLVLVEAVQVRGVRRIDADLERLQPVAVDQALEGEGVRARRQEAVEVGEGGRLAFAEIGEDDPVLHHDRIGALAHALAEHASPRARPASPGTCRRRRTASRGTGSAGRRLRGGRRRGRRRDAGSRGRAARAGRARRGTARNPGPARAPPWPAARLAVRRPAPPDASNAASGRRIWCPARRG